jgi:hypothetical protein
MYDAYMMHDDWNHPGSGGSSNGLKYALVVGDRARTTHACGAQVIS